MTSQKDTTSQWKTTIIISKSLQNHDSSRILSSQRHRVRFSDNVESSAFIFPLSGTAFLLVDPQEVPGSLEESGLLERIETFVQVHRNSFLILYVPFNGRKDLEVMFQTQHRFLGSKLRILPARNSAEIVKGMLTVAKAISKPHADVLCDSMSMARSHIIESSPVWEMLRKILQR